jgi:hypothetical protein
MNRVLSKYMLEKTEEAITNVHNILKGIILGVIFPTKQSTTFLPNVEVLKSNEKNRSQCFVDLSVDMLFPNQT